jgi:hypothetical protein
MTPVLLPGLDETFALPICDEDGELPRLEPMAGFIA